MVLRLDREVLELLRHDPELLAIADAIAATQPLGAVDLRIATPTTRRPALSDQQAAPTDGR